MNTLGIGATLITIVITIILPITLIGSLCRRDSKTLKWAIVGGLVFYLFQIATRIPALGYLSVQPWYVVNIATNTIVFALFLGFTAGLFEEGGRYLAFRYVLRDKITWRRGVAFGLGHGGIEAIYLVGLPFLKELITQLTTGTSMLTTIPYTSILLGGVERLLAMTLHVGFTLIVLYGIKERKPIYLFYAILAHALVDAPLVLFSSQVLIWSYLVIWTLFLLYIILKLRSKFEHQWFA